MEEYTVQISRYIDDHRAEMIDLWRELVNYQAGTKEVERVEHLIRLIHDRLSRDGFACRLIPSGQAPVLVATDGPEREGIPIFFCGHLDTVFPSGSYPDDPFIIQDGIARGPGVLDMKGGVVMMIYIIKALRSTGFDRNPIKLLLCGDEETSHDGSTGAEIIQREASGCLCSFNMEIGRMDNCLSIGRKGSLDCRITGHGKSGHAGNDFLSGRNAIEEMAHKVIALQGLTRYEDGLTVSVDTIRGGTVSNSIPDCCQVEVDVRFVRAVDLETVKQEISHICAVSHIDGTYTEVEFLNSIPVFEKRDSNLRLLRLVNQAAEEYDLPPFGEAFPGGSSDTSYVALTGIPAICSCGVQGKGAHTMEEEAVVETLFQRAKVFASAIVKLAGL